MDTRNQSSSSRGATAVQLLVILVPVLFALMGFAVDLGQLYLSRGELKSAANAMALAAAQKLIGTDQAPTDATSAARFTLDNSTGFANKYNFGSLVIGQSNGTLNSEAPDPSYFTALQDALNATDTGGGGDSTSRHATVILTGETPLTFWSFLPLATDRKIAVRVKAVAGISAPLCTACGGEVFAVAALDPTDTTDFGFVANTKYTLGYNCSGVPTPTILVGTTRRIEYILLNRFDTGATMFADENTQLFRIGAQGLPGNANSAQACFSINASEQIWVDAAPLACNVNRVAPTVQAALCGLTTRFETSAPLICSSVPDIDTLSPAYTPDTDTSDITDYTQYTGNGRRVITLPVVDIVNPNGTMTVLGFRQFLVEPNQNTVDVNPADTDGRFGALYIGSPVPMKQGRFDGCQITSGPGKVVLHE